MISYTIRAPINYFESISEERERDESFLTFSSLIVNFIESVVSFLASSVPNDEFH